MRKGMWVCICFGVFVYVVAVAVVCIRPALAEAHPEFPWLDGVSVISESPAQRDTRFCSGAREKVYLKNGYSAPGCVFGDITSVRIAQYINQSGFAVLAVAFPGDEKYLEVRGVCQQYAQCAYSSSKDVLIDGGENLFYTDFVKELTKKTDPISGLSYYQFSRSDLGRSIHAIGPMPFNALAVSGNGRWAVVEAYEYGFVRVNLDTFEERRVAASGSQYGVANDPEFELAISNSGRELGVVGFRSGVYIYQIDSYCGDILGAGSSHSIVAPSVVCRLSPFEWNSFAGFLAAYSPSFSSDGTRFGITVQTLFGIKRAILSPSSLAPSSTNRLSYLALGDSYSSGEGELDNKFYKDGTDQEGNRCHLSRRSYPYLLMNQWGGQGQQSYVSQSVACSGAQMKDVFGSSVYNGQKDQVTTEESVGTVIDARAMATFTPGVVRQADFVSRYQPELVTVGIGGNDAGLMDKLNSCISPGVCEWASNPSRRLASANEIRALYGKLRGMVASLKGASPGAKIVFVGYPRIINETDEAVCSPVLNSLLSKEERQFMDESIKVLNDTVRAAALSEGIRYVDIEDVFIGHRLCEGDEKAMNAIRLGDDIAPIKSLSILKLVGAESFHPTPYGHGLVATKILAEVPSVGDATCLGCTTEVQPEILSPYWVNDVGNEAIARQIRTTLADKEVYETGANIVIETATRQFKSESSVVVRLASDVDVKELTATVNTEGKLATRVTIPTHLTTGYYTVHLTGDSWSGENIDAYQVIAVTNEASVEVANGAHGEGPSLSVPPLLAGTDNDRHQTSTYSITSLPIFADVLGVTAQPKDTKVVSSGVEKTTYNNAALSGISKKDDHKSMVDGFIIGTLIVIAVGIVSAWVGILFAKRIKRNDLPRV